MICFAQLNIPVPIIEIQRETMQLLESKSWLPHYNQYHYTGAWDVLPLRTPGGDSNNTFADLMNQENYQDTPILEQLPVTKRLLHNLQCEKLSARLLNLKAGAVIKQHRDYELAFEKGEARLHFAIFTNNNVEFYVEDKLLRMDEGQCWYINANLMHNVANYGITDRIHLVVDCVVNNWLENIFDQSEKYSRDEEKDIGRQLLIIENLRLQQTDSANALADKLEQELADGNTD